MKKLLYLIFIIIISLFSSFADAYTNYRYIVRGASSISEGFGEALDISQVESSTYFSPKIRVHRKLCMFWVCGEEWVDLDWWGDCKILWGTGMHRYCARVTAPNQANCSIRSDCNIGGQLPQLCAFDDPMFPIDWTDYNESLMPYHYNTPASDLRIDYVNLTQQNINATTTDAPSIAAEIPAAIGNIITGIGISILESIHGKANYIVDSRVGCVPIPLAPGPPPFYSTILKTAPAPIIQEICSYDSIHNTTKPSTVLSPCVLSKEVNDKNTIATPIVRVTFSNYLTMCNSSKGAADAPTVNSCVWLRNIPVDINIVREKIINQRRGFLSECSPSDKTNNVPCVEFPVDINPGSGNYLALFSILGADGSPITQNNVGTNKRIVPVQPWVEPTDSSSPLLWGINLSNTLDVKATYDYSAGNYADVTDSIVDDNNKVRNLKLKTTSSQMCLYEVTANQGDLISACTNVALIPPPVVTPCGVANCSQGTYTKGSCNSTHLNPALVIGVDKVNTQDANVDAVDLAQCTGAKVPRDLRVMNYEFTNPRKTYNIFGNSFSLFITDENFTDPPATNQGTMLGQYVKDNNDDYNFSTAERDGGFLKGNEYATNQFGPNPNGRPAGNAYYKGGLEFYNGQYVKGGKYACLNGYPNTENDGNVLAKMITVQIPGADGTMVNQSIVSKKPSDRIYPPYDANNPNTRLTLSYSDLTPENIKNQGYDVAITNGTYGTRPKTALELGLCVSVPEPQKCPNASMGNANFPTSALGKVYGTCAPGYKQNGGVPWTTCVASPNDANYGTWITYIINPCIPCPNGVCS